MKLDGTVLGFDVGARRIGVAVGSAFGTGARALAVVDVHGHGPDWPAIDRLHAEWKPDGLVVGEPVHLRFFGSSVRRQDQIGTLLEFWQPDELQELGEIQATLPAEGRRVGEIVQVRLRAEASETGTLELTAVATQGNEHWKVEFDVRGNA